MRAKQATEIVEATSLMDRVERVMARCELIADTATRGKDWLPAIAASRELRGCLELLGKLSGEIQTGTKIGIGINGGGKTIIIGSPEWQASFGDFLDNMLAEDDDAPGPIRPDNSGLKLTSKFMDGLIDE
jgi:hypothetical protein